MAKTPAPLSREVVLIDTSILVNILAVPKHCDDRHGVIAAFETLVAHSPVLLLPPVVVLETGNHIGHIYDDRLARQTADRFVKMVSDTIQGKAPWRPIRMIELDEMARWLGAFPDAACRGQGLGDLSIVKEWEQACALYPQNRVRIWSLDNDLHGYDKHP